MLPFVTPFYNSFSLHISLFNAFLPAVTQLFSNEIVCMCHFPSHRTSTNMDEEVMVDESSVDEVINGLEDADESGDLPFQSPFMPPPDL